MKNLLLAFGLLLIGATAFSQTKVAINFNDLDKDIQKYITKNYDGYTVDKAMQSLDSKGKIQHTDVFVAKGAEKYVLTFDKKDNFIKKEAATHAPHDSTKH